MRKDDLPSDSPYFKLVYRLREVLGAPTDDPEELASDASHAIAIFFNQVMHSLASGDTETAWVMDALNERIRSLHDRRVRNGEIPPDAPVPYPRLIISQGSRNDLSPS